MHIPKSIQEQPPPKLCSREIEIGGKSAKAHLHELQFLKRGLWKGVDVFNNAEPQDDIAMATGKEHFQRSQHVGWIQSRHVASRLRVHEVLGQSDSNH